MCRRVCESVCARAQLARTSREHQLSIMAHFRDAMARNNALSVLQLALVVANVATRAFCGLRMIIADCDETFNYWEPLNFLLRGFGKQTWEYSPEYAIRSYAYLVPYYVLAYPLEALGISSLTQFYVLRLVALCGFTAYTEYRLFRSIQQHLRSSKVANWFLFFSTVSPGMLHASVALLPSSFAMNWVTLATANVLPSVLGLPSANASSLSFTFWAIAQFGIGGIVGWPFALALALPFAVYTMALLTLIGQVRRLAQVILGAIAIVGATLVAIAVVDSALYQQRFALVPFNIVLYNVFGGEGEGPEIFGVEDFSYYVLNLLLNFNVVFILGYVGAVLNLVATTTQGPKLAVVCGAPLCIWLAIFGSQPHKEERFLYPIYPLICLNGAILINYVFAAITSVLLRAGLTRHGKWVFRVMPTLTIAAVAMVSYLRIFNLIANYSAPLQVFGQLYGELEQSGGAINVCVGREWYHYPNSMFLPDNARLRFVQSGFNGLLPGDFAECVSLIVATSAVPLDMNNKNRFEASKVVPFNQCHYYIDNTLPVDAERGEQQVVTRTSGGDETGDGVSLVQPDTWQLLHCSKMISMDGYSHGIGKILWIPKLLRWIMPYNVDYMRLCALKKID